MVLGTVSTTSASIPLLEAPTSRSSSSFLSRMVFISSSRACTFLPKVSFGGGGGGVNAACLTFVGPPRPSCVCVPCLYLLSSTSRSKGRKTELANGARKADRNPPLCSSPTCCCSKMRLLLAAGVRL